MTDLTVQRTLVKSPPELWSELSEVEGLARHLGELGEIRITRTAPETTVAWEGDHASGTVEIEPAGWGTKVTLTAAVSEPAADAAPVASAEPPVAAAEPPVASAEPPVGGAEGPVGETPRLREELDRIVTRAQDSYRDELAHWGERRAEPSPGHRRSRLARLWRRGWRRGGEETIVAQRLQRAEKPAETVGAAERSPPAKQGTAPAQPAPVTEPSQAGGGGEGVETPQAQPATPIDPDHVRAVLEHALESLGAAHHRPFSRDTL